MDVPARPADLWIAEQVEAVAVAIAMALVLKFFVVEAYQIPTGSMQPTILGDAETGIRDRVLADKLCTMLRDPRRWEVMIFRFPHDERRLYVKRIVGLPGETLEIRGGDVWIDGRIARKPDAVNDSVLKDVFPGSDGGIDLSPAFRAGAGVAIAGRAAEFVPEASGALVLKESVRAGYLHGYDPDWQMRAQPGGNEAVADLELSCTARVDDAAGALELGFTSDEGELFCRLRPEGGPGGEPARPGIDVMLRPVDGGPERRLGAGGTSAITAGRPARVVARHVDREFLLLVDGEVRLRLDDDASGYRTDRPTRAQVSLAVRGGGRVEGLALRRDIYYTQRTGRSTWQIPGDAYFALGDNTQGSHDSRGWELQTYRLADAAAPGGVREVTGFWFPPARTQAPPSDCNPRPLGSDRLAFADVHGDETAFDESDVLAEEREPAPFIPRRCLLGKAVVVFWPILHPFRWKFIR